MLYIFSFLGNQMLFTQTNYNKVPSSQNYGFSSSHVWMWEMDHKEGWVPKNWCFWTVVLEKTLESPLHSNEVKSVNPKGNQSWIFIGRTDAEVEAPILWPPDAMGWLIGKDPDAGKDWGQEEKETTEEEMVGWHQWLNGHELEEALDMVKDWEAWCGAVHGVAKSWTQLSNLTTTANRIQLEKKKIYWSAFQFTQRILSIYYILLSSPHQRDIFIFLTLVWFFFFP